MLNNVFVRFQFRVPFFVRPSVKKKSGVFDWGTRRWDSNSCILIAVNQTTWWDWWTKWTIWMWFQVNQGSYMSIFFESEAVWSTDMERTSSGKGCQVEIPTHVGYSDNPMHFCLFPQGVDLGSTWWSVQTVCSKSKRCLKQLLLLAQTLNTFWFISYCQQDWNKFIQVYVFFMGILRFSSEFEFVVYNPWSG